MRLAPRFVSTALAMLLAGILLPAPVLGDEQLYDVELIIFRHADATSREAGERWPRVPEPARFSRYADLASSGSVEADTYLQLSSDALRLRDVAQRLERSNQYEVLVHAGWRQPGLGNAEAAALRVPLGSRPDNDEEAADTHQFESPEETAASLTPQRPPRGLSGYVRVYRERFLHAELNLRYLSGEGRDDAGRASLPLFEEMEPVVVVQERRRMRSNELHHLDHPVIGTLIRVTPVD